MTLHQPFFPVCSLAIVLAMNSVNQSYAQEEDWECSDIDDISLEDLLNVEITTAGKTKEVAYTACQETVDILFDWLQDQYPETLTAPTDTRFERIDAEIFATRLYEENGIRLAVDILSEEPKLIAYGGILGPDVIEVGSFEELIKSVPSGVLNFGLGSEEFFIASPPDGTVVEAEIFFYNELGELTSQKIAINESYLEVLDREQLTIESTATYYNADEEVQRIDSEIKATFEIKDGLRFGVSSFNAYSTFSPTNEKLSEINETNTFNPVRLIAPDVSYRIGTSWNAGSVYLSITSEFITPAQPITEETVETESSSYEITDVDAPIEVDGSERSTFEIAQVTNDHRLIIANIDRQTDITLRSIELRMVPNIEGVTNNNETHLFNLVPISFFQVNSITVPDAPQPLLTVNDAQTESSAQITGGIRTNSREVYVHDAVVDVGETVHVELGFEPETEQIGMSANILIAVRLLGVDQLFYLTQNGELQPAEQGIPVYDSITISQSTSIAPFGENGIPIIEEYSGLQVSFFVGIEIDGVTFSNEEPLRLSIN